MAQAKAVAEDRGQKTEDSWQIRSDAETRGHGDAERKDQRSEVGGQRSEVGSQRSEDRLVN